MTHLQELGTDPLAQHSDKWGSRLTLAHSNARLMAMRDTQQCMAHSSICHTAMHGTWHSLLQTLSDAAQCCALRKPFLR